MNILRRTIFSVISLVLLLAVAVPAHAEQSPIAGPLQGIGIDQHMGQKIPEDIQIINEFGEKIPLASLPHTKPVILSLVYYKCPMLCTLGLNDLLSVSKLLPQNIGRDYEIWTVSFDPEETPQLAADKKKKYIESYARIKSLNPDEESLARSHWRFFTADAPNIAHLTDAVGFRYRWDAANTQFIHPVGITILSPQLAITRYFFGINYDPLDVRLSLVDASNGKIATPTDQLLLFCYHYDETTGKYGLVIRNVLRASAALTILALSSLIGGLWFLDRKRTRRLDVDLPSHAGDSPQ